MNGVIVLFIVSFFLSSFIILFFKKIFYSLKILDNPTKYNKKRAPIPYSMGVVFFLSFFIVSFFFIEHNYKLYLIWIFGFIITVVSFIDDMIKLSPKIRLFIQILIGFCIGMTAIKVGYISNIFGGVINLENFFLEIFDFKIYLVSVFFTIIWYVFIFNALNWTDGIEGNTSGLSIISFLILFFLGWHLYYSDTYEGGIQNANFIISLSIILIAILIPFWFFDVREKILMGDSGTMFLGFMLATLAIISGGKIATVLVVFGIYSIDALYVVFNRIKNKKNPLQGDYTHLHHRLLSLGLTKKKTLIYIYSFSFFFGILSLFMEKNGKIILFMILCFFVFFSTYIIAKVEKKKK